jgi:hypothetical protein
VYYTGGRVAAERRAFEVGGESTSAEISAYPLRGLGMDGKRIAPAALTANTQEATPTTLVEIADLERGYLRALKGLLAAPRRE